MSRTGAILSVLCLSTGAADAGSFDTLIHQCVDPSVSPRQISDYATAKLGFRKGGVDHAAFRMAREEAFYVKAAGFRDTEEGKEEPEIDLAGTYLKKMKAAQFADKWTARSDTTGIELQQKQGVSLMIWESGKSPIKGCLLLSIEPHGAIPFPDGYETVLEYPSTTYGSSVKYTSSLPNFFGIIDSVKPTTAFNAFAPFRPQTTSLLFVSSYGNFNAD